MSVWSTEWATHTGPCWGMRVQVGSVALPLATFIVPAHYWKPNNIQWDSAVCVYHSVTIEKAGGETVLRGKVTEAKTRETA